MHSSRLLESQFVSGFSKLSTNFSLDRRLSIDELRSTLGRPYEVFSPIRIIAHSILESIRTAEVLPLTGALDLPLTTYLQELVAALGENAVSIADLAGSQVCIQQGGTLAAAVETAPRSMAWANPTFESVQVTKLMASFTDAIDRLVPPYHQGVTAALAKNSMSRMTSVAAKPIVDHPTKTLWPVAESLRPPITAANLITESVQLTNPMPPLTDAIDRLVPPYHQGVAAAVAKNSRSQMASLACDTLMGHLTKTLSTIAEVSSPSMAIANPFAESSLTGALDRLAWPYHWGAAAALGEDSISGTAFLRRPVGADQVPSLPNVSPFGRTAKTVEDTSLAVTPSTARADDSIFSSTFEVFVPSRPVPTRPRECDDCIQVMPKVILWEIERTLRKFLEQHLRDVYGDRWYEQSVPKEILKRWTFRQEKDRNEGRLESSLIDYSDFMDLLTVITDSGNWDGSFEVFFENKEDIIVSFRRLAPLRNSIAHNRKLNEADQITLIGEAHRILSHVGRRILFLRNEM